MSDPKYYALSGDGAPVSLGFVPDSAVVNAVWLDEKVVPGCIFSQASWIKAGCTRPGLIKHDSDALLMLIGGDPEDPEELGAEIELWIENDKLTLTHTCFVFVPAGAAYGNITVRNVKSPVFFYSCLMNASSYQALPAQATAPAGTYAGNYVEKYAPVDGRIPEAPEGFLKFLLWIDGKKLSGAPYMEAVWFLSSNDTGPAGHAHDFDEIIGFIGSDPEHPEELGAEVQLVLGERIVTITKSGLFFIPRGITHSPIIVPRLDRPIYHFSGGNGGDYIRK
jgi:hypothetical protein